MADLDTRNTSRRKFNCAARMVAMNPAWPKQLPPVLFLTDPVRTPDPLATVNALPRGWGVVYRHFGVSNRRAVARSLIRICRQRKLAIFVSEDPVLMDLDIDGVHWPRGRRPDKRIQLRPDLIHTASAHDRNDIAKCQLQGFSACLVSSVFPSQSPTAPAAMTAIRFRSLARMTPMPLYGLGGVNGQTSNRIARWSGLASVDGIHQLS